MNSICHLCDFGINEGSVCRDCRLLFKSLSINETKFNECIICEICDVYGFPCNQCAKDVFNYSLGCGNGYQNTSNNGEILDADQLMEIISNHNNKSDNNKTVNNKTVNDKTVNNKTVDEIIDEAVDEIITKKRTSYYSYCSLQ